MKGWIHIIVRGFVGLCAALVDYFFLLIVEASAIFLIIRVISKNNIWICYRCKVFRSLCLKVISGLDLFVYLPIVFISIEWLCLLIRD